MSHRKLVNLRTARHLLWHGASRIRAALLEQVEKYIHE